MLEQFACVCAEKTHIEPQNTPPRKTVHALPIKKRRLAESTSTTSRPTVLGSIVRRMIAEDPQSMSTVRRIAFDEEKPVCHRVELLTSLCLRHTLVQAHTTGTT